MARTKTTIYLEPDPLSATKRWQPARGRHEYEIVEDALRAYMRSEAATKARRELRATCSTASSNAQTSMTTRR